MNRSDPELMRLGPAARYLGITTAQLLDLARSGVVPCVVIDGEVRFSPADVDAVASTIHGSGEDAVPRPPGGRMPRTSTNQSIDAAIVHQVSQVDFTEGRPFVALDESGEVVWHEARPPQAGD